MQTIGNYQAQLNYSSDPSYILLRSLNVKTGLPPMAWMSIYLPVLALVQTADQKAVIKSCLFERSDLAHLLNLPPALPIGYQLALRNSITAHDAARLDSQMFEGRMVDLRLRIDRRAGEVPPLLLAELESHGLIESSQMDYKNNYWFIDLTTSHFTKVCQAFWTHLRDLTVILSVDGAILFV